MAFANVTGLDQPVKPGLVIDGEDGPAADSSWISRSRPSSNTSEQRWRNSVPKTLVSIARGVFSTLAAMIAPCSVKALGRVRENLS